MSQPTQRWPRMRWIIAFFLVAATGVAFWCYQQGTGNWSRGEALEQAFQPLLQNDDSDESLAARAIWQNYRETRANAVRWSGVYWGFTFTAAALSALAALVLKLESFIRNEALKKDVAATLSVVAALLMTISTSGDFQRKWQANRIAAAELERTGYQFLEHGGANARTYFARVGQILLQRHQAIIGGSEQEQGALINVAPKSAEKTNEPL